MKTMRDIYDEAAVIYKTHKRKKDPVTATCKDTMASLLAYCNSPEGKIDIERSPQRGKLPKEVAELLRTDIELFVRKLHTGGK